VLASFPLRNAAGRIQARRLTVYRFRRSRDVPDRVVMGMATFGPGHALEVDLSRRLRGWADPH
jgi:hypothetical protein